MDEESRKSMPVEKLRYPKSPKPLPRTKSLVDIPFEKSSSSDDEKYQVSVKWSEKNEEEIEQRSDSVYENLPATTETFQLPDVIKHKPRSVSIVNIPIEENSNDPSIQATSSQEKSDYYRKSYEIPSFLQLKEKVRQQSVSSDDSLDEITSPAPPVKFTDDKTKDQLISLIDLPPYQSVPKSRKQNWGLSNNSIYGNIPYSTTLDELNTRTSQLFVSTINSNITPPQILEEHTDTSSSESSSENEPRYSNLPLNLLQDNHIYESFTNSEQAKENYYTSQLSSTDSEQSKIISPTNVREFFAKESTFDDVIYDNIGPIPTLEENATVKTSPLLPTVSTYLKELQQTDLQENITQEKSVYNVVYDELPSPKSAKIQNFSLPNNAAHSNSTLQDVETETPLLYDVVYDTSFPKIKDNIFMKSSTSKYPFHHQQKLEDITAKEILTYDEVYNNSYPLPKFEDGSLKISSSFPSVSLHKVEIPPQNLEEITENLNLLYDEVYESNFPFVKNEKENISKPKLIFYDDSTSKVEEKIVENLPLPPSLESINKNLERISNLKINFSTIEETKDESDSTTFINNTIEITTPIIEATNYCIEEPFSDSSDEEEFYFTKEPLGETIIFRYDSMPDETINKIHAEQIKSSIKIEPTYNSDSDEEMIEEVIYDVTVPNESETEIKSPHVYDDVSSYDVLDDPPPPPLPKRGILIPKEEIIRRRPSTSYNILPVSSDLGLRKRAATMKNIKFKRSDSSSSESSVELDVTVRKQLNRFSAFLQNIRTNTESKFKKSKSSDTVELIEEIYLFARPAGDVNCTIKHFGILSEKIGDERIKWKVSLENGILKWISEHGEDSLVVLDITSITAVNNVGSEWSHGVSICYVSGSPDTRVRSFSCRSEAERDTWLRALLGAATAAFPARLTRQFTRAGWLHVKEETGAPWQPSWMLLTENHVAYCEESGGLRELDLRNAVSVVSQTERGNSVVLVELQDCSLYLRAKSERDTIQWEKYLFSATKNIPRPSEQPYGGLVAETEKIEPPRSLGLLVGQMHVAVHIGLFSSAVIVQITLGPHTTAGEVCSELGRGEDHMLQEFVLGGALARPLHASERVLEVVMRWGDWDMQDQQNNQLVFASCQFYLDAKAMARPRSTASGKLRVGFTERRDWKWYWMELSQNKIRLYKKETSSRKRKEWKVNDIVWYLGHERSRNPHTKWSITFIKKENKPSRSRTLPHFGVTLGGYGREELLQWSAALLVYSYPGGL